MTLQASPFALDLLHGLLPFELRLSGEEKKASSWYCFTASVARSLRVTARAVPQLVSRHLSAADEAAASVLCVTRISHPVEFPRVLSTYAAVKQQLDGDSLNSRKSDKFSLYPLPLVEKLLTAVHTAGGKVDAGTVAAVHDFAKKHLPAGDAAAALGAAALPHADSAGAGAGSGSGSSGSDSGSAASADAGEIKVKIEPRAQRPRLSLPVALLAEGGIPVIDLTNPATLAALSRLEGEDEDHADVEQTLSSLVDNFAQWHPVMEEYAVLREYGLRPDEVSVLLQEQCQRFSEYRQEIWNWHRDPSQVTPRTVGNNIRVFLLFGGFVCHSTKRHRLKPAAFDMSVFGSKHIEAYIMDFLHYLHGSRQLLFSSIANYLNSLVVLAKFYFVDNPLADVSFSAERVDSEFVLAGLRRVRAQTNTKAKAEAVQKPVHAQWLSWPECQQVRRACEAAFLAKAGDAKDDDEKEGMPKAARRLLKSLVCLYFYTIAPPPRCSIVRLLQWRTTLVKKRADPSRYVIDLKNNPDAPASQHKTIKHYRRAVLPLPKSMTSYLDRLRKLRSSDYVFVNSRGQPYSTSSWTHFVKTTFAKFSGERKKAPGASLARSIFVTWLNGVPYDARDSPFLEEMKLSAAEYQTHSLTIANSHYDKDAASEAKLRVLVDFCDSYAQWRPTEEKAFASAFVAAAARGLPENIDSDEDEDETMSAAAPADAPAADVANLAASSAESAPSSGGAVSESKQRGRVALKTAAARRRKAASSGSDYNSDSESGPDSSSSSSSESDDPDSDHDDESKEPFDDEAEYLPDRIVAKKTVAWRDFYLIHWLGYSVAERTWEPAAFFDQWCTKQTYDYEQARRPARVLALKVRPPQAGEDGKAAAEYFFEVQWQGHSETSMEREQLMRDDYPDAVKEWEQSEHARLASRKHHLSAEEQLREQPASKRRRTGN